MSQKHHTIIIPLIAAILPVIAAALLLLNYISNQVVKNEIYVVKTELGETITSDIEKGFEIWIEDQIVLANTIANEPSIIEACLNPYDAGKYEKALKHLKIIKNKYEYYENIFTLSYHGSPEPIEIVVEGENKSLPDGSIFMSSAGSHVVGLAAGRNYSTELRGGKEYFLSEVYPSLVSGTPIFVLTVPVYHEGQLIGAAGVAPKTTYFTERFGTQENFGANEYVFIMDEEGNVLAHPDSTYVLTEEGKTALTPLNKKIQNNEYLFEDDFGGNNNLYIAKKMEAFQGNRANNWYFFYRDSLDDIFADIVVVNRKSILFSVIAIIIVGIIIYLVSTRIILRPLKTVAEELKEISKGGGDLTTSIKIKSMNEVGMIAGSFNSFIGTLREMIIRIRASVNVNSGLRNQLASSTEETSAAVNEILSNIQSIQNIIKNLVAQTDTAGSSTSEISIQIDELTGQAGSQSSAVEQSTAAVEQMISSLKNMAGTTERNKVVSDRLLKSVENSSSMLDETYNSIQKVNTNISSIMEMTDVIDNISSQTNLLAMNAAIEAAHAGESGKGFAVVADEIRKLAEDSSSSSSKIAGEVKTIIEQIQHSSDFSKELQTVIGGMVEEISGLAFAFSEINSSSLEMSAGSDQVLNAMFSLSELSIKLSSAAEKMKEGTHKVSTNIASVLELSQTANAAIEEISFGSNEILSAMINMQDNVQNLGDSTGSLSEEVDSFKTD